MVQEITTAELRAALDAGKVQGLFDNRGPGSVEALRIKGAKQLSVPDAGAGVGLPEDKGAFLVFY